MASLAAVSHTAEASTVRRFSEEVAFVRRRCGGDRRDDGRHLADAEKLMGKIGPMGIDAATRIVGSFVSAIGGGLIFDCAIEALEMHGVSSLH